MKIVSALLFSMLLAVSAVAQTQGIIECQDKNSIRALEQPGSIVIVRMLSCGQEVTVLERSGDWTKVLINGMYVGFVEAKYVRVEQGLEGPPAKLEEKTFSGQAAGESPTGTQHRELSVTAAELAGREGQIEPESPRRHEGGLYFDASHIYYAEPHLMRNKGFMWGVSGDYTFRPNNFMLKLDGRFGFGNVDYWSSGTGTAKGLRDYNIETRFSFGYNLTGSYRKSFTPFTGLGYRFLFDGLGSAGPGGYDRKQNYLYSPMGIETMFRFGEGWSLGLTGEYDLFWHGWNRSEFGDAGLGLVPLKFDQNDGWGARSSIKILKNLGKIDLAIEPYFRYWDIDKSDLDFAVESFSFYGSDVYIGAPFGEPQNTTKEWGIRVGIRF